MENFGSRKINFFFIIESLLYIIFLVLDITRQGHALSGILKFVSIFLCACFVWSERNPVSQWKHRLFKWSYVFLIISDVFLLFTSYYGAGLITFILVQLCYFYYLVEGKKNKLIQQSIYRFVLFLIIIYSFHFFFISVDHVLLLAAFYFIQFFSNVFLSILSFNKNRLCFSTGLLLFFLCDINVGLYQAGLYISNEKVQSITILSGVFMWFFYLPGQVLLAYSAVSEK